MGIIPLGSALCIKYWLILERDFEGSIRNVMGAVLWILLISVGDFAFKDSGGWFNRDITINVFRIMSSTVRNETNERCQRVI